MITKDKYITYYSNKGIQRKNDMYSKLSCGCKKSLHNRRDLREMIFKTFPELSKAYSLKELYRNMNKDCSYDEAINVYDDMLKAFKTSGIRQFKEFTEILINWRDEILNSYLRPYDDRKLSNSFTENVNGKLRTYLSISRGISNFQRFRKRGTYKKIRE